MDILLAIRAIRVRMPHCELKWEIPNDTFSHLIKLGLPMYGYHLKNGDYLLDIGTAEKYKQANLDMKDKCEKWPM